MPFKVDRFKRSLEAHVEGPAGEELGTASEGYDAQTSPAAKAQFLKQLMDRMDEMLEEGVRRRVMEECGRQCIGRSTLKRARKVAAEAGDLDDLLARFNQAHLGGHLRREGDVIHGSYTRCYCGSVSKTSELISPTYCHCSCGWYKQLFEAALERPVEVELVESIVQGAEACRFVIRL